MRIATGTLRHKVRDGIHGFVAFDNVEKALIDSGPFQRLRDIHQLAMCYQVYPGARHTRFEHSIGVMAVADRIFGRIFLEDRVPDPVRQRIPEELLPKSLDYWRGVVRVAALLHDVGHLPFSHAAEDELLPAGWNHERLTVEILRSTEIASILQDPRPRIDPKDVVDLAWDVRKRAKVEPDFKLSPWKFLLSEIITGNTFGADRIDYLLRDSWHAGVGYGRFDPDRLIDGLRVVIDDTTDEVALGLDIGGIYSAEALLLARYFMFTQVYFHDVRRAYDLHLKDFLKDWLPDGRLPSDWSEIQKHSDSRIIAELRAVYLDPSHDLYRHAARLVGREHFRTIYKLVPGHRKREPEILARLYEAAVDKFDAERVRLDVYGPKGEANDFPVVTESGDIVRSQQVSEVIANLPPVEFGLIFVEATEKTNAKKWMDDRVHQLLG